MILVDTSVWVGHFRRGDRGLADLPSPPVAEAGEVLPSIERPALHGKGIAHVDVHLPAAVALSEGAMLWSRAKGLRSVAESLGCAHSDQAH